MLWILGGMRGIYMDHRTFFVYYKNGKSTRAWPILKTNSTSLWFNFFFPRMNNKNFTKKGGPRGLLFLYEVSIVLLIDFIATLLTPAIFLIQIVNTNMYLIHFHSKNIIKMHFPKSLVLRFQILFTHSIYIAMKWNKLRWHQKRLDNTGLRPNLKKSN